MMAAAHEVASSTTMDIEESEGISLRVTAAGSTRSE